MKNKISFEKVRKFVKDNELYAFIIIVSALAIVARIKVFDFASNDYNVFLSSWVSQIIDGGGFAALKNLESDYTPAYLYILAIISYIPKNDLYLIKAVSVAFDFIIAAVVGLIVRKIKKDDTIGVFAYTAALFYPSIFLNGAVWAQCDAIFTAFIVLSLYFMLKDRSVLSGVFYGISFAFKLQAVFFLPVFVLVIVKKKINLWTIPAFILSWFAVGIPALIVGMPFDKVYLVYFTQAGEYSNYLSLNAPSIFNWIATDLTSPDYADWFASAGVYIAIGITALCMLPVYRFDFDINDDKIWITITAFFAALLPFIMPHMHERYWYLSDVFALIFVIIYPKRLYVGVGVVLPSLYVVCKYLFGLNFLPLPLWTVVLLIGIVLLGVCLYKDITESSKLLQAEKQ